MGRIMAIDYGTVRTGIAVTDPLKIIANGLTTIASKELVNYIKNYIDKNNVEKIVFGKPIQMSGEPSDTMSGIVSVIKRIKTQLPDIPVELYDERFTSVLAHRAMLEGGMKKSARRNKAVVDMISATIILQSYMESRNL